MRIHSFYLSYFLLIFSTSLSVDTFAQMFRVNTEHEDRDRHYLLYLPTDFTNQSSIDLVIGFHGYGGTASGLEREVTGNFNQFADKYNFIALYPQSVYFFDEDQYISTFNDTSASKSIESKPLICTKKAHQYPKFPSCKNPNRCSYQPCIDDLGFIKNIIEEVKAKYSIKNIYVFGNSTGGMFAQRFGCTYPELIKGIMNVIGMQALGFSCTPNKPVNFTIYGALEDTSISPVKSEAPDGYLYEPMKTISDRWVEKFGCTESREVRRRNKETFIESVNTGCQSDIIIKSILNIEGEHLWPESGYDESTGKSSWVAYGFCATELQSDLNIDLCRENARRDPWGTEYLVRHLLNID